MPRADLPILRTSERTALKRCPQRWWWEYREGYKPKGMQADSLWFGIGIHEALAQWYKKGTRRGRNPARYFEQWAGDEIAYVKSWLDEDYEESVWLDALELGVAMLEGYVALYGKDPQWYVIATEQPFSVRITHQGKAVAIFRSRWDIVFRNLLDGRIYLGEHKTAAQIILTHLDLDDQGGSYWAVAATVLRAKGILAEDEEIAGIQYNFLRKQLPDERPENAEGQKLNKPTKDHYVEALRAEGIRTVEQSSPKHGPIAIEKASLHNLEAAAKFARLEVLGDVSAKQPAPLFVRPDPVMRSRPEQHTQLQHIADEMLLINAYKSGALPVTKTPTKDCVRCPFHTPCVLHERGYPSFADEMKAHFLREDPYGLEGDDYKSAAA